jgi:hypothetical protein
MTTTQPENAFSTEPAESDKLSAEDKARVEKYLASPIHQVERKPFRPIFMIVGLITVVASLSLLSLLISTLVLE